MAKKGRGNIFKFSAEDIETLRRLASNDANYREIAAHFRISEPTLSEAFKRQPEAYAEWEEGKAILATQLKRALFEESLGIPRKPPALKKGEKPLEMKARNITALIFALKNVCGYRDKTEQAFDKAAPLTVVVKKYAPDTHPK